MIDGRRRGYRRRKSAAAALQSADRYEAKGGDGQLTPFTQDASDGESTAIRASDFSASGGKGRRVKLQFNQRDSLMSTLQTPLIFFFFL